MCNNNIVENQNQPGIRFNKSNVWKRMMDSIYNYAKIISVFENNYHLNYSNLLMVLHFKTSPSWGVLNDSPQ